MSYSVAALFALGPSASQTASKVFLQGGWVMRRRNIAPLAILCLTVTACGGGGGEGGGGASPTSPTSSTSPATPAAPTAPAPAGCSGTAVNHVKVSFNVGGGGSINLQVFGEAFNQAIAPGQDVEVDRTVVPCQYEVSGQMQNRSLEIAFGRGNGISTTDLGGVERGSIVVEQGPNPTFSASNAPCKVLFTALPGTGLNPPLPIKIRFRVSATNGVGTLLNQNSGCS